MLVTKICAMCKKLTRVPAEDKICPRCWVKLRYEEAASPLPPEAFTLKYRILSVVIYLTSGILVGVGFSIIYYSY